MSRLIAVLLTVTIVTGYVYDYQPRRSRACFQPKKVGPCRGRVRRWVFNSKASTCHTFSWGGCQPNGNNFESLSECKETCRPINQPQERCFRPKSTGFCEASGAAWFYNSIKMRCEMFSWGGCQTNENHFETLVECRESCPTVIIKQSKINVCSQPKKEGPCRAVIPNTRWFYNSGTSNCEMFNWGGCQPNGNNFGTISECQKSCQPVVIQPPQINVCTQPKKEGPCRTAVPTLRWFYNPITANCELFNWGGCVPNGNNFETLMACGKTCQPVNQPQEVCFEPRQTGPCRNPVPRWFYDSNRRRCEIFNWGGCQPNGNNFITLNECIKFCSPPNQRPNPNQSPNSYQPPNHNQPRHPCFLPPVRGPCEALFNRYYYDSQTNTCKLFIYGGCQGNANRFNSAYDCAAACQRKACRPRQPSPECFLLKGVGPCNGHFDRYHYDFNAKMCKYFIYGGCGGNGNNFVSLQHCEKSCGYQTC